MLDNPFANQYRFDYFKPVDNEDNDTLNPNMMVNNDDDVDDDKIIPLVSRFGDVSRSSFIISNYQTLSFRCMTRGSEFEV